MIKNILDKNNIAYKIIDEEGNTELLQVLKHGYWL